jgi:hypothetical protein
MLQPDYTNDGLRSPFRDLKGALPSAAIANSICIVWLTAILMVSTRYNGAIVCRHRIVYRKLQLASAVFVF